MPNPPRSLPQDVPGIQDTALSVMLAGTVLSGDAAPLQQLAGVLAALESAPASDGLAGKGAALAEFRSRIGVSAESSRTRHRRPYLAYLAAQR
ncbi:MAG TPA: hypothetical protein VKB62_16480 [Streptosporangiaceae bacterium]|nr:hypothetical protein [Streptosporangiaceae bacterium]